MSHKVSLEEVNEYAYSEVLAASHKTGSLKENKRLLALIQGDSIHFEVLDSGSPVFFGNDLGLAVQAYNNT